MDYICVLGFQDLTLLSFMVGSLSVMKALKNFIDFVGNMFVDQCNTCQRQFVRKSASQTVGQKVSEASCPAPKPNGRSCRGRLADFVLDWEDELPDCDLDLSISHATLADLSIVLGSTLQIIPSGNLPTFTKKYNADSGKFVIINLQPTKHDKKADLLIHDYVDKVMALLCQELNIDLPDYDPESDPVKITGRNQTENPLDFVEWTQSESESKRVTKLAEVVEDEHKRKRKAARADVVKVKRQRSDDEMEDVATKVENLDSDAPKPENETSIEDKKDVKLEPNNLPTSIETQS